MEKLKIFDKLELKDGRKVDVVGFDEPPYSVKVGCENFLGEYTKFYIREDDIAEILAC